MHLLPPGAAAAALGLSTRTLARWVACGYLRCGEHYLQGPHANSPRLWDVPAVRAWLALPSPPAGGGGITR